MTEARSTTLAERIVAQFDNEVTEAHVDAICGRHRISEEQFNRAIPLARDLTHTPGHRLTPIYPSARHRDRARPGWWTIRPTERILVISYWESQKRNIGEQERNARQYDGLAFLEHFAHHHAGVLEGTMALYIKDQADRLNISAESDYIIQAIDEAEAAGKLVVAR